MKTRQLGDLADRDAVVIHRARAKEMLNQITQQAKQALVDAGIDMPLFFMIPNSGDSILTFGTLGDPDDGLWSRVGEIVVAIVQQSAGLDRTRCQPVTCATTA
jgi:hypothetical protein